MVSGLTDHGWSSGNLLWQRLECRFCKYDNQELSLMRHIVAAVAIGAVMLTFSACNSQEEQIRQMRFGFRNLNLLKQLENDELTLKNDQTENDIAQLERQSKT
jgi:hypothetical protein